MRAFWDARAREDALHFVDGREPRGAGDLARFLANGERDLDALLGALDLRIAPDAHVLDLGCGVGRLTRILAARAAHVSALDVSAEMLMGAWRLPGAPADVRWLLGDGRSLAGVADASVDAVVSHLVFEHLPDPGITLGYVTEIGRVLRCGGWAAFGLSTDGRRHRLRAADLLRTQRRRERRGSAVGLDDLGRVAAAAGLVIERVVGAGTPGTLVRASRADGSTARG